MGATSLVVSQQLEIAFWVVALVWFCLGVWFIGEKIGRWQYRKEQEKLDAGVGAVPQPGSLPSPRRFDSCLPQPDESYRENVDLIATFQLQTSQFGIGMKPCSSIDPIFLIRRLNEEGSEYNEWHILDGGDSFDVANFLSCHGLDYDLCKEIVTLGCGIRSNGWVDLRYQKTLRNLKRFKLGHYRR